LPNLRIQKSTKALVVTSKDSGIKVKTEKTEYSLCVHVLRAACRTVAQQKAGDKFFEKYLGTTLTNQNSVHDEIKNRWKSGVHAIIWYCLLSSILLSKNIKINIYITVIFPVLKDVVLGLSQ
jgi:hypothetical protein